LVPTNVTGRLTNMPNVGTNPIIGSSPDRPEKEGTA
jgi:hypothetical protein